MISGKKPLEGKKAPERENGQFFGQSESQRRGSAWSKKKIGHGDTGECSARGDVGRRAQEVTTQGTRGIEPDRRREERFRRDMSRGEGSGWCH